MIVAFALLLIGAADLARTRRARAQAVVIVVAVWIAAIVVALVGLGLSVVTIVIAVLIGCAWLATTSAAENVAPRFGLWPVGSLVVVIAVLALRVVPEQEPHGFLVDQHAALAGSPIGDVPLDTLVLGAALVLFLMESSNVIVRAALYREPELVPAIDEASPTASSMPAPAPAAAASAPAEASRRRWPFARRKATAAGSRGGVGAVAAAVPDSGPAASAAEAGISGAETPAPAARVPDLKGGRLIGPLERLIIVAVVLSGSYTVVGALVAAKGIVRFPEISKDEENGSKAEYFLVGSLVSWATAIGASVLLNI